MTHFPTHRTLVAAAIVAALSFGAIADASADARDRDKRRAEKSEQKGQAPAEAQYPGATRQAPEGKASAKGGPKLQKLLKLYDEDKAAEARALADEILANSASNAYERSFAAQIGAHAAYDADDTATAMAYLNKAIDANGLDNNAHFGALYMLAQLQMQEEKYAESLATVDRFLAETRSQKPEHLVLKGNALYRLDRYPEAAAVLKQAIDASPEAKPEWQQLLMAAYAEGGNAAEAARVAEQIAAKNPTDKRAQMNLAVVYMQNDMDAKAVEVMEKLRAAGQLTDEKEYRNLYATYYNMDGKEKEMIAVINEGLQKGVLKPDYQTHVALAQAHYNLDQMPQAIDAFRKAAPLAPDGQTYLNLANLLWQDGKIGEAKDAARQAIAKGLKTPAQAQKILALPGK